MAQRRDLGSEVIERHNCPVSAGIQTESDRSSKPTFVDRLDKKSELRVDTGWQIEHVGI